MNRTLDLDAIKEIIPHRSPILLADTATITDGECVSFFWVDPDMEIFKGHFPGGAVLPGAYILEAMAQCADILLLGSDPGTTLTPLLFSVRNLRFMRQVMPGDTLTCRAALAADAGDGLYEFNVSAFKGELKVASGVISISLK